jgi:hypothetical protein
MSGLSDFNSYVRESLPFKPKQLSDFPPYWIFEAGIQSIPSDKKIGIGANFSFESTGSKMSLADYSGEYSNEFTLNSYGYSISFIYTLPLIKNLPNYFDFKVGLKTTELFSDEFIKIGEVDSLSTMTAESNSFFFEPGFTINYPVSFFEVGLKLSYLLDFGGDYKITSVNGSDKYNGYPIVLPYNLSKPIQSQWTGLRIRLNFSVNITKLIKNL